MIVAVNAQCCTVVFVYVSVFTNEFTISESRNGTGEERTRQALCDKRDINFVLTSFSFKQAFS